MPSEPSLFQRDELPVKTKKPLRSLQVKVYGDPLAGDIGASFIKPAELVNKCAHITAYSAKS